MKRKFILLGIFLFCLLGLMWASTTADAQESPNLPSGKISQLDKGEPTPFAGILLSPSAYAKIVVQREYEIQKEKLKLEKKMEKQKVKFDLKIESYKDQIDMLKKSHKLMQKRNEQEIKFLRKRSLKSPKEQRGNFWKGFGTGAVTILSLVGAVYIVKIVK